MFWFATDCARVHYSTKTKVGTHAAAAAAAGAAAAAVSAAQAMGASSAWRGNGKLESQGTWSYQVRNRTGAEFLRTLRYGRRKPEEGFCSRPRGPSPPPEGTVDS